MSQKPYETFTLAEVGILVTMMQTLLAGQTDALASEHKKALAERFKSMYISRLGESLEAIILAEVKNQN